MARNPITFQNGTLVANAKVEVDGTVYDVTPAQYEGSTPLSANNLNQMQTNIYDYVDEEINNITEIYSTDEIKTNEIWINGKPIYRKVVSFNVINGYNNYGYNINADDIWIDFSNSFIKSSTRVNPVSRADYRSENYSIGGFIATDARQLYVMIGSDTSLSGIAYITLKYTKTTD